MNKFLVLLVVLIVQGCAAEKWQSPELLHEHDEDRLITEQEFMARVARSATSIYEGLSSISSAAQLYALDHDGRLPPGNSDKVKALLLESGYLNTWPVVPPFAFTNPVQDELSYMNRYGNLDNIGEFDDVIYAQDLKIEVCEEFSRRYSSSGLEDVIYDYEANKDKFPGETIGRHITIYAISWSKTKSPDYCDVEWVVRYND